MSALGGLLLIGALLLVIVGVGVWFNIRGLAALFPEGSPATVCADCGAHVDRAYRFYCTSCRGRVLLCTACVVRVGPENVKCADHQHVGAATSRGGRDDER